MSGVEMNELINEIAQRTGIREDKARQAAEVTINFLKSRFPAIAGHLDSLLQGGGASRVCGTAGKVEEGLGSLLGKKSA
jgi:hypothetical protein